MTHRLATNYAKNYCNRTPIVKVIVENVVTCFFWTQCRVYYTITIVFEQRPFGPRALIAGWTEAHVPPSANVKCRCQM